MRLAVGILLLTATGAAPASALISSEEGKSGATVTLYDGGNGHLGINAAHPASKLDVRGGEVRVGNSGAACSKNNEGAIRYDDNRLWVCNAKGWQSMAFSGKP